MKYKFSFTALGLAPVAMQEIAAIYRECGFDSAATYERVIRKKCSALNYNVSAIA